MSPKYYLYDMTNQHFIMNAMKVIENDKEYFLISSEYNMFTNQNKSIMGKLKPISNKQKEAYVAIEESFGSSVNDMLISYDSTPIINYDSDRAISLNQMQFQVAISKMDKNNKRIEIPQKYIFDPENTAFW